MKFEPRFPLLLKTLCCALLCVSLKGLAQGYYDEDVFKWADNKPVKLPAGIEKYSGSDLVILDEQTDFNFYIKNIQQAYFSSNYYGRFNGSFMFSKLWNSNGETGTIVCSRIIKINSKKGLDQLKWFRTPESFDAAYDAGLYKQGRLSRIKIPYIKMYKVKHFMARRFANNRWTEVKTKDSYGQIRWIRESGEFADADQQNFELQGLEVGDVVEIYYDAKFSSDYGANIFYFHSAYPKLKCNYNFTYQVEKQLSDYAFVLPVNIPDSLMGSTSSNATNYTQFTYKFALKNLKGINYPTNCFEAGTLPHVCVDFDFHKVITSSVNDGASRLYNYQLVRPRKFEWLYFLDTVNHYTRIYDKHFSTLRKFCSTFPPTGNDSANYVFFKALCDTFNNFRHLSTNQLYYNESNLYAVSSDDHLLRRRVVGDSMCMLYRDILNDKSIFYYRANLQDKRYSEHNFQFHAHQAYEADLLAIPTKDSYFYFMPRYDGMKYHLNELPFYYEGALASLSPNNFQKHLKNKESFFKFIKTHQGTFNENTRTENAVVQISLDSMKAGFVTKESLSGQFSTVLRHLYLNEYIDSTIAPYYFKKCTSKPGAADVKIKLSSKITEYPFRYTFNCSEKVKLPDPKYLHLKNWFSFTLSKDNMPEKPNQSYYFDFAFSDSYNFLLQFAQAVEIPNSADFSKKINTDLFELESEVVKNSESSYLLKVRVAVKHARIPEDKLDDLMQLVATLDELNNFSLELDKK